MNDTKKEGIKAAVKAHSEYHAAKEKIEEAHNLLISAYVQLKDVEAAVEGRTSHCDDDPVPGLEKSIESLDAAIDTSLSAQIALDAIGGTMWGVSDRAVDELLAELEA